MIKELGWGLGDAVPDNARGAWGARAIVNQAGLVDILHDRQSFEGNPDILSALTDVFPLSELREVISDLLRSGLMSTREEETFVLHQEDAITAVADTNGSAGYCYIAAWCL